jgi:hypothetical protein
MDDPIHDRNRVRGREMGSFPAPGCFFGTPRRASIPYLVSKKGIQYTVSNDLVHLSDVSSERKPHDPLSERPASEDFKAKSQSQEQPRARHDASSHLLTLHDTAARARVYARGVQLYASLRVCCERPPDPTVFIVLYRTCNVQLRGLLVRVRTC